MSEVPETQIIGVFHDRDAVERAIEAPLPNCPAPSAKL